MVGGRPQPTQDTDVTPPRRTLTILLTACRSAWQARVCGARKGGRQASAGRAARAEYSQPH
jgi:hypothetical protein